MQFATKATRKRGALLAIGAVASALAVFASGTMVGRATADEAPKPASPGLNEQRTIGQVARDSRPAMVAPNTGQASGEDAKFGSGSAASPIGPAYGCDAPIGDVISGTGFDPAKQGFAARLPGAGWTLASVSLRSEGACNADGSAGPGKLVMDTTWLHDATGLRGHISQRVSDKPELSVMTNSYASFWDAGYQFHVDVNGYHILPAGGAGNNGSDSVTPVKPSIVPAPENDPRSREVLEALVTALQPKGGLQCFYREAKGSWDDLTKLGIGDPRPGVPSGMKLQDARVTTYTAPGAGCDTTGGTPPGTGFSASWVQEGSKDFAMLHVSAYRYPDQGGEYPGNVSQYGANWSNGEYQFSVGLKSEKPLGDAKVREIAKLLDPKFEQACFVQERKLTESDLASLGLRKVKAPSGFSIIGEWMTTNELNGNCTRVSPEFSTYTNIGWNLEDKAGTSIQATINQRKGNNQPAGGWISENHISWNDGKGTEYYVNGFSRGVSGAVSKELLLEVAKSLDPSLDESKLQPGGDVKSSPPIAQPQPATR